jgi:L-alanine-DL-glutamate epimerase-like enolase superfamily enzyme
MKISHMEIAKLTIPLTRPFVTALRTTSQVEDIVVRLITDTGLVGYGSAAATPVITGDSSESIVGALSLLAPRLIGQEIANFEQLLLMINSSLVNNNSAKAALDIALHDLVSQSLGIPLYQFLGSSNRSCTTLTTISVQAVAAMVKDAQAMTAQGFTSLKLKLGLDPQEDIARVAAIRQAVGPAIALVGDANQGWQPKAALQVINALEQAMLGVRLVEQPVASWDMANLKYVRDHSPLPIFADESVFSIRDAAKLITGQMADGLNLKLAKSGGIYAARAIYDLATAHRIPCMAGCMLESPIGLAAMASLVVGRSNIQYIDLDPITMIKHNPVHGGLSLTGATLTLSTAPGLGISAIDGLTLLMRIDK